MSVNSNSGSVLKLRLQKLKELQSNFDEVARAAANAVLPELRNRVHVQGKASDGNQIGTYSKGYMAVRTGNFGNSKRKRDGSFKEQKKKGDAGTFTKGSNKIPLANDGGILKQSKIGLNRPVYNRSSDTKVILSLTRMMEEDLKVMPSGNGYGIGYSNSDNYNKAIWNEATYGKKILTKLTAEEVQLVKTTVEDFLSAILKD